LQWLFFVSSRSEAGKKVMSNDAKTKLSAAAKARGGKIKASETLTT